MALRIWSFEVLNHPTIISHPSYGMFSRNNKDLEYSCTLWKSTSPVMEPNLSTQNCRPILALLEVPLKSIMMHFRANSLLLAIWFMLSRRGFLQGCLIPLKLYTSKWSWTTLKFIRCIRVLRRNFLGVLFWKEISIEWLCWN